MVTDADDADDPVVTCPCGWRGHRSGLADDGPGHEWCCPMCGRDIDPDPDP